MFDLDRRFVLQSLVISGIGATGLSALLRSGFAQQVYKEVDELKPGEFTWHPERSPAGPVAVVVSVPDQRVHVYRNSIRIAISTCSTGAPGHSTPTGVFTILEKDKNHYSSTYNDAPMPNMNRLTWSGIALHAGKLPGYPASHGCVRLPLKFSELLFSVTHIGTPVLIAGSHSDPREIIHPGMVLGQYAEHEFEQAVANLKSKQLPGLSHEENPTPPTSILISRADRRGYVFENGHIVAEGRIDIKNPDQPLGSHVFILVDSHDGRRGLMWHGIGHHSEGAANSVASEEVVITRLSAGDVDVIEAIKTRMHPGLIMVMTDLAAHPDTRSDRDFVVMNADDA
jgi:hypothetical protein